MFSSKKDNKTLSQYYADFNRIYEELKVLFSISRCEKDAEAVGPASSAEFPREFAIRVYSCTSTGDKLFCS